MSDAGSLPGSPTGDGTLHEEAPNDDVSPKDLGDSDRDSDALSDIDEDQFDDYDPSAVRIEERPVEIDEDVARTLKASKRKGTATKKPKEGRREKKRARDRDDEADGEVLTTKRARKTGGGSDSRKQTPEPEKEENLTPEERRRRAIERAAAKEKPKAKRRKKKDEDVCALRYTSNYIIASTVHFILLTRRYSFRTWRTKWMRRSPILKSAWRKLAKLIMLPEKPANPLFTS